MAGWSKIGNAVGLLMVSGCLAAKGLAQCPAVGHATTCGAIITISDTGATVSLTGQGPYDGSDDTLVGVVNNSNLPVTAVGIQSGLAIFEFDGDGLTTFGIAGNALDA